MKATELLIKIISFPLSSFIEKEILTLINNRSSIIESKAILLELSVMRALTGITGGHIWMNGDRSYLQTDSKSFLFNSIVN
jgi:hypothetical protein